jgi:histidine ammonia-lyase
MKKLVTLAVVASAYFAAAPLAVAQDQWATSLCEYTKADDKNRVRKVLSDNKVNVRKVYDAIQCNGESLIKFAMRSDAYETGAFFVKQMPAKALVAEDLEAWAAANGFGASPLINDIKARIGQD